MYKAPTELAAEILSSALGSRSLGSDEATAKFYEIIFKKILQCRQEERDSKIDKPT